MDLTITLTLREEKVLKKIANKVGIPYDEYAHNIIRNFLQGQVLAFFQDKFNKKTISELAQMFGDVEI